MALVVRTVLVFVPTPVFVFFQHYMVWEDLKPLKLKKEPNSVLSSPGQKLLHARDENNFVLYHFVQTLY